MRFPTNTLAIANLYAPLSAVNASVAPIVITLGGHTGAYLLAGDVIPQDYMLSAATGRPLQIVFCSATNSSGTSAEADDTCTFRPSI